MTRLELAELGNVLDADGAGGLDDVVGDVRELEEGRGGRVDGLEEELLEVEDGDEGREPVVRESDGGEAGTEGEGDGNGSEFLCRRGGRSAVELALRRGPNPPSRRTESLMGTLSM